MNEAIIFFLGAMVGGMVVSALFSVFYRWEEKECIIMIMWMQ